MRRIHSLFFILVFSFSFAQTIYTKDGVELGEREEVLAECIKAMSASLTDDEIKINVEGFCICFTDTKFPEMDSSILESADAREFFEKFNSEDEKFEEEDELLLLAVDCVMKSDLFTEDAGENSTGFRNSIKAMCIETYGSEHNTAGQYSEETIEEVCDCVATQLISASITSDLILDPVESKQFFEDIWISCATMEFIAETIQSVDEEATLEELIEICKAEWYKGEDDEITATEEQITDYCRCAIEKAGSEEYKDMEVADLENEHSRLYNEVILGCLLETGILIVDVESEYDPEDIHGGDAFTEVPYIPYSAGLGKFMIDIGGVQRYFLLDTGSSDLVIDRNMEQELLGAGLLTEEHYLGKGEYQMADGSTVKTDVVFISGVKLGDYTVDNVVIAIMDEGGFLAGGNFLNKFKDWELDKKKKVIRFYK